MIFVGYLEQFSLKKITRTLEFNPSTIHNFTWALFMLRLFRFNFIFTLKKNENYLILIYNIYRCKWIVKKI